MRIFATQTAEINPEVLLRRFVDDSYDRPEKNHTSLDWPAIQEAIAARAKSALTADCLRRLPLLDDFELISRRYAEVQEAIDLYDGLDPLIGIDVIEIDDLLLRAQRGGILCGEDLLKIAQNLTTFHAMHNYFRVRQADLPLLWSYAQDLFEYRDLEKRIRSSFDADGLLLDSASPELARLRERSRRLSDSLRTRIEAKLAQTSIQDIIQDSFYTQREGRYVLPVKSQHRSKLPGIVHATSSSGQTVFVEPADLVELNNALRVSDFGIEAEEQRILLSLSMAVGDKRDSLAYNLRRALYLDGIAAIARFSIDCSCHIPDISDGEIEIYQSRHPLLALRHFEKPDFVVIANDIMCHPPKTALIISGANAGGKTVNLKTVGLFALMLKSGVPICAGQSSCFPIFERVFADIGDDQSIDQNISTFSAHVQAISAALEGPKARCLFLLDEPFSGTDPEHATPLSIALLTYLHEQSATCFATTHYENVKAFALNTPWTATASVGFDLELMRPTYRLMLGQPGTSSAFEIAAQHGLAPEILSHAQTLFDGQAMSQLEHAITRLEKQRIVLDLAQAEVDETLQKLTKEREEIDHLRKQMRAKVLEALGEDIASSKENIQKIRSKLRKIKDRSYQREAIDDLETREKLFQELKQEEHTLEAQSAEIGKLKLPDFTPLTDLEARIGAKVFVPKYNKNATILTRSGQNIILQLGPLRVQCKLEDLGKQQKNLSKTTDKEEKRRRTSPVEVSLHERVQLIDATTSRPLLPQTEENTLDLRGETLDDALERTDFFINSICVGDQYMGYVIHGHGTGILKSGIRQFLKRHPRVAQTRKGDYYEGGDGVTLFWIS